MEPVVLARLRRRLTYATVVSSLCLFILLGGGAYAASALPGHSVGKDQLKAHAITPSKVAKATVALFTGQKGGPGQKGDPGALSVGGGLPAAAAGGATANLVSVGSPVDTTSRNHQNEPAIAIDAHHPDVLVAAANDK